MALGLHSSEPWAVDFDRTSLLALPLPHLEAPPLFPLLVLGGVRVPFSESPQGHRAAPGCSRLNCNLAFFVFVLLVGLPPGNVSCTK